MKSMNTESMTNTFDYRILVIGAGVSGLTTALCLKKEGFKVKVVAEKFAPQITSVVAGALWEWPPAVCGGEQNKDSVERSKEWCITSYTKFSQLALAKNAQMGSDRWVPMLAESA